MAEFSEDGRDCFLKEVDFNDSSAGGNLLEIMKNVSQISSRGMPDPVLSMAVGESIKSPNRIFGFGDSPLYGAFTVGFPELQVKKI